MKKIINRKAYDTTTAKEIGTWCSDYDYNGLYHVEETLYVKRTGEFFILGSGGASTKYAKYIGNNSWSGGQSIIPVDWETARDWAEKHLDVDTYNSVFGDIAESGEKTIVTLSINSSAIKRAKREASRTQKSLSEYIESLI